MPPKNSAIKSAQTLSALRAAAAREKDPAVKCGDYLAKYFLGFNYTLLTLLPRKLMKLVLQLISPGSYCFAIIRTKHFDNTLLKEIDNDVRQLVILGAGYDTRAFRFADKLKNITVFEVDFPGTQLYKIKRLARFSRSIPVNISFIPCDFTSESFEEALLKNNFSPAKKTIFLWEGVSYYLPERVVRETLSYVNTCASGSSIIFDYSTLDFVKGDFSTYGGKQVAKWLRKINEPFLFGMNTSETFLNETGLKIMTDYSPDQLEKMYLQTSSGKMLGRTLGHVRMTHAFVS